jgi:hypothetical protein
VAGSEKLEDHNDRDDEDDRHYDPRRRQSVAQQDTLRHVGYQIEETALTLWYTLHVEEVGASIRCRAAHPLPIDRDRAVRRGQPTLPFTNCPFLEGLAEQRADGRQSPIPSTPRTVTRGISIGRADGCASQAWIYRLALEREHSEHTLVEAPQGLFPYESLQPLHSQSELPQCKRALRGQAA